MKIKSIVSEDFVNYKKPSMFIIFPYCSFKCDKECGAPVCQNSKLAAMPIIEIAIDTICQKYINNPITSAIVCGGLEPFDSESDLLGLVGTLRNKYNNNDDIVIYTGYTEEELSENLVYKMITEDYKNIIIKFGRYLPAIERRFEPILGVELASVNQYAKEFNKDE